MIPTAFSVYSANFNQKLEIKSAKDIPTPGLPHYVHVIVENKPRKFINRATANDCRSSVLFIDKVTGRRYGPFSTKWATRPNPVQPALNLRGKFVLLPDETMIDQAKSEDIHPGMGKPLDIAVKLVGDKECYVHEPENFFTPNYRPPKCKLEGQEYIVRVHIIYAPNRRTQPKVLILENRGTKPEDLILKEC